MKEEIIISIDREKAKEVFDILIYRLENKLRPYDIAVKPQDPEFLPKSITLGSIKHALFLFYTCLYMRGAIKSADAIKKLTKIYNLYPELFNPYSFSNLQTRKYYRDILSTQLAAEIGYSNWENVYFWERNSQELVRYWDGDPRNVFKFINNTNRYSDETYIQLCYRIIKNFKDKRKILPKKTEPRGFCGFQEKMVSMLAYFYVDAKIIKTFLFPAPVDFHVMRMLKQTEVFIVTPDIKSISSEHLLPFGRDVTANYCKKYNVDAKILADTLWLYSTTVCSGNPNNKTFKIIKEEGRKSEIERKLGNFTKSSITKYNTTCGACVIKKLCTTNVPQVHYYKKGIIYSFEKNIPPQEHIFTPDQISIGVKRKVPKREKIERKYPIVDIQLNLYKK